MNDEKKSSAPLVVAIIASVAVALLAVPCAAAVAVAVAAFVGWSTAASMPSRPATERIEADVGHDRSEMSPMPEEGSHATP